MREADHWDESIAELRRWASTAPDAARRIRLLELAERWAAVAREFAPLGPAPAKSPEEQK